jgi:pimeloyl-ACP methyl ester carboxylesterase
MRIWARRFFILIGVLLLGFGGFVVWWLQPFKAGAVARAALQSSGITVTEDPNRLELRAQKSSGTGLIFYPGARVDPDAYAPVLSAVAQAGYEVFIVKMPLNLAVLGPTRADEIIAANPNIKRWAIAGHSLGGAMACSYVNNSDAKNSSRIKTLVFWAAYCAESFDLSKNTDLRVTSISGSNDGIATSQKQDASRIYAPSSTKYVVIEGMNHAQFGDYGPQDGDKPATLENAEATRQLVAATLEALRETN